MSTTSAEAREKRSRNMAAIRSRDTKLELRLRSALHRGGLRFRVNVRGLPGTPDIVFTKRRLIVFVHGCFWHRHDCANGRATPKTNAEFWAGKFADNVARDVHIADVLKARGWRVIVVWECQLVTDTGLDHTVELIRRTLKESSEEVSHGEEA